MIGKIKILTLVLALGVSAGIAFGHAHTHIGRNQDQTWGNADDDKLWFFSMPGTPGWPDWDDPLELILQDSGPLAGKYACEYLYCWHSAHPEHGNWQLGGTDPAVTPDWRIAIERVSFDAGFGMREYDTFTPVLTSDGDTYEFPKIFMADKYNENGQLGAWGFHYHLWFVADAGGPGETFNATFRARDFGTTGYTTSEDYTIPFVTVPEPATTALLGLGALVILRRRGK